MLPSDASLVLTLLLPVVGGSPILINTRPDDETSALQDKPSAEATCRYMTARAYWFPVEQSYSHSHLFSALAQVIRRFSSRLMVAAEMLSCGVMQPRVRHSTALQSDITKQFNEPMCLEYARCWYNGCCNQQPKQTVNHAVSYNAIIHTHYMCLLINLSTKPETFASAHLSLCP